VNFRRRPGRLGAVAVTSLMAAAVILVLGSAAAQARGPRRLTPGVRATAPSAQALSQALAQATGLATSQVSARDICPAASTGHARCSGQALVLRSTGRPVRPHVGAHATLGRVKSASEPALATPATSGANPPQTDTPAYLQQAYDLTALSQNDGSGDTIAIVDAYDDPSAASDLATYRSAYGLPACTTSNGCFRKVSQTGSASSLPASNANWEQEESLDLDAVSAICPNCHIILVEANSNASSDLDAAEQEAEALGANQISDSWTITSSSPISGTYTFPGIATVAATGDTGYVGPNADNYPAAFPGVTAAGGTDLAPASSAPNARGFSESAWSLSNGQGGGSGCDLQVGKPSWQTDTGCTGRSYADLSADADPSTGLIVYDSSDGGWLLIGGTSLSTPLISAYYAITGVSASSPQWAYSDSGMLNDIVSGSNGTCASNISYICNAGVGYDGPTGVGAISGAVVSGAPGIGGPAISSNSTYSYTANIRSRGGTIDGGVYPNGLRTTWWIQYGTTTSYGNSTPATSAGSGTAPASITGYLSQLTPGTTYNYRVVAQNSAGTTYGYNYSFTTLASSPTTPTAAFTRTPAPATPGSSVSYNATGSTDSGATITDYTWNWGDGSPIDDVGSNASTSHTYTSPGVYNATLIVTNGDGQSDSITHTITVDDPTASFTVSPTVPAPNQSVNFNGSGSTDPESTITGYSWTFGDGGTSTSENPTHTYSTRGTYTVSLTVTNSLGQTNTDTQSVTVDNPPTAAFTPSPTPTTPNTTVSFDGSASTPGAGGTITDYSWNFGDGTTQDTGTTDTASHTYSASGEYTVTLTVTDNLGVTSTASHTVTIDQPIPTFTTSPSVPAPNQSVSFNASGSTDPESTITDYSWNFGDGSPVDDAGSSPTTSHTYTSRGTYNVTLTVTDNLGLTNTISRSVTVDNPPTAAFAATPSPSTANSSVSFDGSASTPGAGGTIEDYSWNFGDGTQNNPDTEDTGTTPAATHTYTTPGVYTLTLTVTDDLGVTNSISHQLTVDSPPSASFTATPNPVAPGSGITFNASGSSDSFGTITGYSWTFGDGGTSTSEDPTHTYATRGTYDVTLTVTNDAGQTGTITEPVTVDTAPTATFTDGPNPSTANSSVSFNGSGSAASAGGSIVDYSWNFGDGTTQDTGTTSSASHAYSGPGTYTVTLTVTDDLGLTTSVSHQVTVDAPPAASFAVSANPAVTGSTVGFDAASSSDSVGTITGYSWSFGDGATSTGQTTGHEYSVPGTYTIVLTVTNDAGQTNTATRTLTVYSPPAASFSASPDPATAGSPVTFSGAASSDSGGAIMGYSWNFGDGTTGGGESPSHTYAGAGTYSATLTVTGSGGLTTSTSETVVVDPKPTSPPPALTSNLTAPKNQKLAPVLKHGLKIKLAVNQGAKISIQVTIPARATKQTRRTGTRHVAPITLLQQHGRAVASGTNQITVKLSAAAARKLPGSGPVVLTVKITVTGAGGTVTRTVKVALQR
jgi:PKD repeat protein